MIQATKMAMLRLLYRRFNLIAAILITTSIWVLYLIVSAPAASDEGYVNSVMPHVDVGQKPSVTRRVSADLDQGYLDRVIDKMKWSNGNLPPPPKDDKVVQDTQNQGDKPPAIPKPPDVNIEFNPDKPGAIDPVVKETEVANNKPLNEKQNANKVESVVESPVINQENKETVVKGEGDAKTVEESKANGKEILKNASKLVKETVGSIGNNLTKIGKVVEVTNKTNGPVLDAVEKKVLDFGKKMKNKTIGEWESVKNKTLEKLTDLGVIQKPKYVKLIYRPVKWYLNISLETIGNIMKDTEFLIKKQNLTEMEYQPLLAPNSTLRINLANSSYGLGFCDCEEFSCVCCVRMFNKWMQLNSTACSKITFESKSQELNFEYSVDKLPVFSEKIAAEFPPKICMESTSKVVGICVLFANVTSKVTIDNEDHKIHLSGCMEFDLTLYNKTVSAFPVGCFQIPNSQVTHENKVPNLGNFMP